MVSGQQEFVRPRVSYGLFLIANVCFLTYFCPCLKIVWSG